jgi:hypothetical protein
MDMAHGARAATLCAFLEQHLLEVQTLRQWQELRCLDGPQDVVGGPLGRAHVATHAGNGLLIARRIGETARQGRMGDALCETSGEGYGCALGIGGHDALEHRAQPRLGRADRSTGEHQFKGCLRADKARQALRYPCAGHHAQSDLRRCKVRGLMGHAGIGGQRQRQPRAEHIAVEGGNHGQGARGHRAAKIRRGRGHRGRIILG